MRRLLPLLVAVFMAAAHTPVSAEPYALVNGRSANLSTMSDLTIEGGFVTGDYGVFNYDHFGLRVNYRLVPGLIAFVDLGRTETGYFFGSADGTSLGLGAFYQLRDLIPFADSSAKVSFHKVSGDIDESTFSVELLISGLEPLTDSGLNWYANTGIHRAGSTDLGLGGGIFMPLGPGELFVGADHIDDITFGVGFRYSIR